MTATQQPKVILAGAGPGDVDLITVKAVKYLEKAAYIFVDRLVNREILRFYAAPTAEVIYVGKHGGKESTRQAEINALLVEYARKEGLIVRLKGGDVAFFSNVVSEIEVLEANNIPFELVPGITAASGASASLKMPLTARELSRGVRLLTYQSPEHFTESDWKSMGTTADTLVFYMSGRKLPELINRLKPHSTADKPLAIIEQATTPQQRVLSSSLLLFDTELAGTVINQPALIVIGDVTRLAITADQARQNTISFFKEH
jgi:uroporphyrin-III C-methyltransferase